MSKFYFIYVTWYELVVIDYKVPLGEYLEDSPVVVILDGFDE